MIVPTYGQVRQWTAEPLECVVRTLNEREGTLVSLNDEIVSSRPFDSWRSPAADLADEAHKSLTNRLEDIVGSVAAVRRLTADIADRVVTLQGRVAETEASACRAGFRINDDGIPVPLSLSHLDPVAVLTALVSAFRLHALVRDVMRSACEIDDDFAFVLNQVADDVLHVAGGPNSLADAAAAGAVRGSVRHERLLDKFHVDIDDRPLTPLGHLLSHFAGKDDDSELTRGETDLLLPLGLGMLTFREVANEAMAEAAQQFPGEALVDDRGDAFRHTYWNALMTKTFGDDFATDYGTAHEQTGGDPLPHAMDLHNNEIGRTIAENHPGASREELAQLVRTAVDEGRTVEINELGELVPTGGSSEPPVSPRADAPHSVRPLPYGVEILRDRFRL